MGMLRLDRLLTLGLFQPLHPGSRTDPLCFPILMYHSISGGGDKKRPGYFQTTTSEERFARQMRCLSEAGYRAVDLDQALEAGRQEPGSKLAVITFDDGFRDFHEAAFPELNRYGFTATVYLPTAFIADRRRSFKGIECLTWKEVRELQALGIRFGSHTVNHGVLRELPWNQIDSEVTDSKARIEEELGARVTRFAYPFAFPKQDHEFARRMTDLLRLRGYASCVTTVIGRARQGDNRLCLNRLPVNDGDDEALFGAKLDGAYDWLGFPQQCYKAARQKLKTLGVGKK